MEGNVKPCPVDNKCSSSDNVTKLHSFSFVMFYKRISIFDHIKFGLKRIHHWCLVGTGISQPKAPNFQWEKRHAKFPTER